MRDTRLGMRHLNAYHLNPRHHSLLKSLWVFARRVRSRLCDLHAGIGLPDEQWWFEAVCVEGVCDGVSRLRVSCNYGF